MIAFLQSIDPKLFYLLASAISGLLIYVWRKVSMETWDAVTRRSPLLQNLPAMILSGLMSAAPAIGKDFWHVLANIVAGAFFSGAGAIVGHHVLKDAPFIPYAGANPPKPPLFPEDGGAIPSQDRETPRSMPILPLLLFTGALAFGAAALACYKDNPICRPGTVDWPRCDDPTQPRRSEGVDAGPSR